MGQLSAAENAPCPLQEPRKMIATATNGDSRTHMDRTDDLWTAIRRVLPGAEELTAARSGRTR
jgi:hypothetical protein